MQRAVQNLLAHIIILDSTLDLTQHLLGGQVPCCAIATLLTCSQPCADYRACVGLHLQVQRTTWQMIGQQVATLQKVLAGSSAGTPPTRSNPTAVHMNSCSSKFQNLLMSFSSGHSGTGCVKKSSTESACWVLQLAISLRRPPWESHRTAPWVPHRPQMTAHAQSWPPPERCKHSRSLAPTPRTWHVPASLSLKLQQWASPLPSRHARDPSRLCTPPQPRAAMPRSAGPPICYISLCPKSQMHTASRTTEAAKPRPD